MSAVQANVSAPLTVAHIEDDPLWTEVVAKLVAEQAVTRYLGAAATGRDGIAFCRENNPGVAIVDLRLPDMDGFRFIEALRHLGLRPRILFLSSRMDDVTLYRTWQDREVSLIWKSSRSLAQLRACLETLTAGRRYIPEDVRVAIDRFRGSTHAFFKVLSPTEQALLPYFGAGRTDREIADDMGKSAATVKWHRHRILTRLGLHRTLDLVRWAEQTGFTSQTFPSARLN